MRRIFLPLKQVRIILKKFGMRYAKPFPHDHRTPPNAEELLKKLTLMTSDTVIGFLDETSPQTTANSQRLWAFTRPVITKNTTKIRANTFGFYALNGTSVIVFREHSRKEDVCAFLDRIREENPGKDLLIILDNFRSHHANETVGFVLREHIDLVYLPPYSPDFNPLEYIWKSIKRIVSVAFIQDLDHFKDIIESSFYARKWNEKFLSKDIKYNIIGS